MILCLASVPTRLLEIFSSNRNLQAPVFPHNQFKHQPYACSLLEPEFPSSEFKHQHKHNLLSSYAIYVAKMISNSIPFHTYAS